MHCPKLFGVEGVGGTALLLFIVDQPAQQLLGQAVSTWIDCQPKRHPILELKPKVGLEVHGLG